MINYVTGNEYTGQNYNTLAACGFDDGDAFVTFKQAIKIDGYQESCHTGTLLKIQH